MAEPYSMLSILLASPVVILFVHAGLMRLTTPRSRQMTAVRAALLGAVPTALLLGQYGFPPGKPLENCMAALYCAIVYGAIGYTYFHFFNTSETARRVRLLYEIYRVGGLTTEQIAALYKTSDIIDLRLRRLVDMKQLNLEKGHYSMASSTLYYAAVVMVAWQRLLGFR